MNGMTDPSMPLLYVDTNPFIYFIQGDDSVAAPVKELFGVFKKRPGLAVTSELTLAEILPKAEGPLRRACLDLIVWSGAFDLRPVTREILIETADYRRASAAESDDGRKSMVKLPDAIHVVTAIRSGCRRILSNDAKLRLPAGYQRVAPDGVSISALVQELQ